MPTDDELLASAPIVVVGTVVTSELAPDTPSPATDYWVELERPVKGFVPASTLLVQVPGGVRPDGLAMRLLGAPSLRPGDRAIFFLEPHRGGAYRIVDFALGVFLETQSGSHTFAHRQLEGSTELVVANDPQAVQRQLSHRARDFEPFVDWLIERSRGNQPEPDYYLEDNTLARVRSGFRTTQSPSNPPPLGCGPKGGNHVRWTQFDRGEPVVFLAHEDGQVGVPGGGFDVFEAAMGIWNDDSESTARLVYGGTTDRITNGAQFDGSNTLDQEDRGDQIPGQFNGFSGTVAVATVYFDCDVMHTFPFGIAHDLIEADIVTQDGSGSFLFSLATDPAVPFGEVSGHELGHTAGLAHSCGDGGLSCGSQTNDALMRAFIHNDGRGPVLGTDDVAGIRFLYGTSATSGTPAAPSGLMATAASVSSIELQWTDNSTDEEVFDVEMRTASGSWQLETTVGANVTQASIHGLPEAAYRVFRVRSRNSIGGSLMSAEASATTLANVGPCVDDEKNICLAEDRFRVSVEWTTIFDTSGDGIGAEITDNTATFWFFSASNIELVVKVLDACDSSFGSAFWVFAGGLTNVLTEMTVVDTATGQTKTYVNPQNTTFEPLQDTAAFFTCS